MGLPLRRIPLKIANIPNPYTMTFEDWRDTLVAGNPELANTAPTSRTTWFEFAERLSNRFPGIPYPEGWDNWQEWAASLKLAYSR